MENYLIPHLKKIKIEFQGIEPIFIIKYKKGPRYTVNKEYRMFYLIYKLKIKFKRKKEYNDFKNKGVILEKCEGCGDGWATWMIDDPNGKRYSITCCDECVGFYDWKWSRRRINFNKNK